MFGARVLTLASGSAVVTQANGCVTRLDPNSRFILNSPSVCQGGEAALQRIGPYYAAALTDVPVAAMSAIRLRGLGGILEDTGAFLERPRRPLRTSAGVFCPISLGALRLGSLKQRQDQSHPRGPASYLCSRKDAKPRIVSAPLSSRLSVFACAVAAV